MNTHLRLVSDNSISESPLRLDGRTLHQLADRMTAEIQTGHSAVAHDLASFHHLSPFGIAIVARWMTKAGLSEEEILNSVVY